MIGYPVTVVLCLLLIAALVGLGRALRRRGAERRLRVGVCGATIAAWVVMNAWYLWPTHYQPAVSWPLHICDLAAIIGPVAVLTRQRLLRSILYFWGLALTTQGFITPILDAGPDEMVYWLFWANHTIVVGLAVYDIVVGGYRPALRDLANVVGVTAVWLVAVFWINYFTGWNYGYVGRVDPDAQTIVQQLGDWPLRVLWMAMLALAAFLLVWLPWPLARRWARRSRITT